MAAWGRTVNPVSRPALRYHGGKFRLAKWIMQFSPPHLIYTEAFGGAAGVLLQKPRCHGEVYNDLDEELVSFFRCLQSPVLRDQLVQACTFTPYARSEFELAWEPSQDIVERARRTCIRAQMGFGSAGATKGTTGLRIDTMKQYSTAQMDWAAYPPVLLDVASRFQGVLIENRTAVEVLLQHDCEETLHYVDPPYVHSSRSLRGNGGYRHEMTDDDHAQLLEVLRNLEGMVVLSGYATALYQDALKGWQMHSTPSRISAGRGAGVRTEVAWLNPACTAALDHSFGGLFSQETTC